MSYPRPTANPVVHFACRSDSLSRAEHRGTATSKPRNPIHTELTGKKKAARKVPYAPLFMSWMAPAGRNARSWVSLGDPCYPLASLAP